MTGSLSISGVPGVPDFEAQEGSAVGLFGEPGTGKSAVLLAVAGVRGSGGAVLLGGVPLRRGDVGLMRQDVGLLPELTAAENVSLPLVTRRAGGRRQKVEAVLEAMRLPPATWYNLAEQLSGGQQQRVGIARALVARPALLCLDEPFTELDGATAEAVWAALRGARSNGAVTVVTTTDPRIAERCDLVVPLGGDGANGPTGHMGRHAAGTD